MSKNQGVWTYADSALVLIDYQKEMFENILSETSAHLIDLNVRLLARAAKAFNIPVVLSTVGVNMGVNGPTRASILSELPGIQAIDRPTMNAWEDHLFREAVNATGRKRLVFGGLYTEICLAFPVVEALKDGYDVTFVVDAVGGMSQLAHRAAVERLSHAGAIPNTAFALVCELFRDWRSPVADKAREIIKWYLARRWPPRVKRKLLEGRSKHFYRDIRVRELLQPHLGAITFDTVKAALFDDFAYPWSVCRPPRGNLSNNLSATVSMVLMEPASGLMEVAPLPALNRQFTTYRLDVSANPRGHIDQPVIAKVS